METCLHCNKSFIKLNRHIASNVQHGHPNAKQYYDLYLKKNGEGECKWCGKQTDFQFIDRGYKIYCDYVCQGNSRSERNKIWWTDSTYREFMTKMSQEFSNTEEEKHSRSLRASQWSTPKDITGNMYDYLTAQYPTLKRYDGSIVWMCLCVCGNVCEASVKRLEANNLTSCGCRKISKFHENTRDALNTIGVDIIKEEYKLSSEETKYPLRLDFLVKWNEKLFAIEVQGIQHYESIEYFGGDVGFMRRQSCDKRKKQMLIERGIPLIEIRYDENDIEGFLRKTLNG